MKKPTQQNLLINSHRKAKKFLYIIIVGVVVMMISSCTMSSHIIVTVKEEEYMESREEEVFSALRSGNKEGLKTLFSNKALSEAGNIDDGIDSLINNFSNSEIKYERRSWNSSERLDGGKKSLRIVSRYNIYIDDIMYEGYIIDYPIDTFQEDNKGLNTFCIIHMDRAKLYWQDLLPGAYILS